MKFAQIIEFETSRIDDFNAGLDAVITKLEGRRIPHRVVIERDRDRDNCYLMLVEFPSYELGMENSQRPEIGEFAGFLAGICDAPLTFRNLDVLREQDV